MSTLHTELVSDPKGLGYGQYVADQPGRVADMLNAPTQTGLVSRFVNARLVVAELGPTAARAIFDALVNAAQSDILIRWMLPFVQSESGIDIGLVTSQQLVDQLIAANVLTADYGTALKNMAMQPISRAQQLGLGQVTALQVTQAHAEG